MIAAVVASPARAATLGAAPIVAAADADAVVAGTGPAPAVWVPGTIDSSSPLAAISVAVRAR